MATSQSPAKARLYYGKSRGLAAKVRMMLCVAEIPFEDVFITERSHFLEISEKLTFHQTPGLEINGMFLSQSNAVVRYLASKCNMFGTNPEEQVKIDILFDGSRDWMQNFTVIGFFVTREETLAKGKVDMEKYCPIFEKELENNKTGFLVGSAMTLADIGLFEVVLSIEEYYGMQSLDRFPNIKAHLAKMKSDKLLQNYLENYRMPTVTPERVKEIKAIINMK